MPKLKRLERSYKAIKTSKNNLIVTLPQEWRELNGIQAGDKLTLYIHGKNLVVMYE